jgi:multidrug efflux pump
MPDLTDVNTDQQTNGLELDVTIDRDTASRFGIAPQAVDDTLYDAYGQRQVATFFTEVNAYRIVMEVKPEFLATPDSIKSLYIKAGQSSVAGTALGGAASGPSGRSAGALRRRAGGSGQSGVTSTLTQRHAGGAMVPDVPNTTVGASGIGSQVGICGRDHAAPPRFVGLHEQRDRRSRARPRLGRNRLRSARRRVGR